MDSTNNIIICEKCRAPLIYEELHIHECFTKTLVNFAHNKKTNEYYAFDGKKWYRGFPNLPTENQQRKSNTDKPTEPNYLIIIVNLEIDQLHTEI